MPMASICTDLHALNCKNCSQMVYWILVELENDIFLVFGFWLLGFSKKNIFLLFPNENYIGFHMKYHFFFCTMDGFFRILEKKLSELICTRLYILCFAFILSFSGPTEGRLNWVGQ